jgi:hypothetical protein
VKPCQLFQLGCSIRVKQVQEVFKRRERPNGSDWRRRYLCVADDAAGRHGSKGVGRNSVSAPASRWAFPRPSRAKLGHRSSGGGMRLNDVLPEDLGGSLRFGIDVFSTGLTQFGEPGELS